jgi:hypothetical protein
VLEAVLVAVEVEKVTLVGIITGVDDENCCGIVLVAVGERVEEGIGK